MHALNDSNLVIAHAVAESKDHQAAIEAQARLNEVQRKLAHVLDEFRDAVHAQMRTALAVMEPSVRDGYLKRVVRSNSSGWNGGPYTDSNVREGITREVYLARLTSFQRG